MENHPNFDNSEIAFSHLNTTELKQRKQLYTLMQYPFLVSFGTKITSLAICCRLPVFFMLKKYSFNLFCGGETIDEALFVATKLQKKRIYTCLNYAVETQQEQKQYLDTVYEISKAMAKLSRTISNTHYSFIAIKLTGLFSSDILRKIQANVDLSETEKKHYHFSLEQIETLCESAKKYSIKLMFDAEESWIQSSIDRLLFDLMETYNKDATIIYTTIQMYRKDRLNYLKAIHKKAIKHKFFIGIKLVRGAYIEQEKEFAKKNARNCVVFSTKKETDDHFNQAMNYCFQNLEDISLFAGTHNEESMTLFSTLYNNLSDINKKQKVIASQLFGMSDHLTFNLAQQKTPVCKYIPYGPIQKVVPYLIRRAQENTSILSNSGHQLHLIESELKRRKKEMTLH